MIAVLFCKQVFFGEYVYVAYRKICSFNNNFTLFFECFHQSLMLAGGDG